MELNRDSCQLFRMAEQRAKEGRDDAGVNSLRD